MSRRAAPENLLKLTRQTLAALTLGPGQTDRVVWDAEVRGLGYRLRASGRASWVIRPPRSGGRSALFTLGAADALDLATARTAARERLAAAALGDAPHAARRLRRASAALLLGDTFDRYTQRAEGRLRPSTLANLRTHLTRHWKPLRASPLASVSRADVAARLHELSEEAGPQAAVRARRTLSTVYAWAIAEGLCETNPVAGTNPPADEVRRERVLTDAELAAVWRACGGDDFGCVVRLLALTGQRRDEVAGMRWSEVDLQTGVWVLPAARTKNKRAHEVPLSAAALDILAAVRLRAREGRDLLFGRDEGSFSGFSRAKAALDRRSGVTEAWRVHDLRRTAATGMAGLGVLPHVVEAVLNHVSGSRAGVAGIYNRASYATEKRAGLDLWSSHVSGLFDRLSGDLTSS